MRQKMKSKMVKGIPDPMALTVNRMLATTMHFTRPKRSANWPAKKAPPAAPSKARDTDSPISQSPAPKVLFRASTAPLITAVSNPKRNPPNAAAQAIRMV